MSTQQKFAFNCMVAKRAPRNAKGHFLPHGYAYGLHAYMTHMESR